MLLAERTALLSGRDDEFVADLVKGCTGMRWGEIVGPEPEFVRPKSIRVEGQLYELDTGELHRCPPKDDSYRDIDTPDFLASLLAGHIARTRPKPCECHGLAYVFPGHGTVNGSVSRPGAKLVPHRQRSPCSRRVAWLLCLAALMCCVDSHAPAVELATTCVVGTPSSLRAAEMAASRAAERYR